METLCSPRIGGSVCNLNSFSSVKISAKYASRKAFVFSRKNAEKIIPFLHQLAPEKLSIDPQMERLASIWLNYN